MNVKLLFIPLAGLIFLFLANVSKPSLSSETFSKSEALPKLSGDTLIVFSMNILHDFPFFKNANGRLTAIAEEIKRTKADVVLIQEDFWAPGIGRAAKVLSQASGLPYYTFARANGNRRAILFETGQAILSRYPLSNIESHLLPKGRNPFENRIVLLGSIQTRKGALGVVCVHMTTNAKVRPAQIKNLLRLVDSLNFDRALVGGDFNDEPGSVSVKPVVERWQDVYAATHLPNGGPTCCASDLTVKSTAPWTKRIDYLFAVTGQEDDFSILDCKKILSQPTRCGTQVQYASDHAGLLAKVVMN